MAKRIPPWLLFFALFGLVAAGMAPTGPPTCANPAVSLTPDYTYAIGSADFAGGELESGSTYRWFLNGVPSPAEPVAEHLLLHLDASLQGSGGEMPGLAQGVGYAPGRWGSALALAPGGALRYERPGNLDLNQGTVEMWVAPRADGDDPVYSSRWHVLWLYLSPGGDWLAIAQAADTGVLYAGGVVDGQWQSAYGALAGTRAWRAGDWHHLAFTYSAVGDYMRFYLDGSLVADTNEGHYWPPSPDGADLFLGGDPWGNAAYYLVDEVRISGRVAPGDEIAARAWRPDQPLAHEVWLATGSLDAGDELAFEFTPSTGAESGDPCLSSPRVYPGIPVTDPQPPSTLLPPGTTAVSLTVQSIASTTCAFALGDPLPFERMAPFDQGAGTTTHLTSVGGLDPTANVVNELYVRCASHPDFALHLRYRSLSQANPSFPRTGNLWGWWGFAGRPLADVARIDLWLGAGFDADTIRELRHLNPAIRVLTSINAVEHPGLPDDYYLKDIYGNKVEVWPGSYRLNLTKPYVAEHQAYLAYRLVLDNDLMFDGVFFDNVFSTQSWLDRDIYGHPFLVDSNEDGVQDDPEAFDAAWKAGVFHEMETFRALMPDAIVSGHAMDVYEPGIAAIFDGIGVGFWTADVIEGKRSFMHLWDYYHAWQELARHPAVTMIESSPPDQIAYGYDYAPWDKIPPSTLEFARTYYPYVRFGLALTLMDDGYFAHEFGDTWHGNDWWYDELDFDLGYPLGLAERVDLEVTPGENQIVNGGFEDPLAYPWSFWANTEEGCLAGVSRDTTGAAEGTATARVEITATSGVDWHVELAQYDRSLDEGTRYDLAFWARADTPRTVTLSAQKGSPDWRNYGLWRQVLVGTGWQEYTVSFEANETASDSRIQFMVGEAAGTVWFDDVRLTVRPPDVYRRVFDNGLVLLNGSRQAWDIPVGPGYRRLRGDQAPLYETILDDGGDAFSTTGAWTGVTYDSGEWQATGPFYHDWGQGCHERSGIGGEARWALDIAAAGTYTLSAWWPAAPEAAGWSASAVYEVISGGQVVAATTLDQRSGGDEWHVVAEAPLAPEDGAYVRLRCPGSAPCIADALHLRSGARYNDGFPAQVVTLQPLDGIVLARYTPHPVYLPLVWRR